MPTISLDQIKKRVEDKYEPLIIPMGDDLGYVAFRQALRMSSTERAQLMAMQSEFNHLRDGVEDADGEQKTDISPDDAERMERESVELLEKMLRLIASSEEYADRYFEAVDHDIATLMTTFELYSDGSELGEASASPASSTPTARRSGSTSGKPATTSRRSSRTSAPTPRRRSGDRVT